MIRVFAQVFVVGCWVVFTVYWVAAARSAKPTAERQNWSGRLAYVAALAIAVVLMLRAWRGPPFDDEVAPHSLAIDVTACLLCLAGLIGALWARRTLAGNWSAGVTFKRDHELIERGPYRYVRHPIYTSMLVMVLGTALVAGRLDAFIAFAIFLASFWIKSRHEEALMMRHFPDTYPAYRNRVKALVPFVL